MFRQRFGLNCEEHLFNRQENNTIVEKGKIIILNGVSSAGKTTLAKALQGCLEKQYYLLSGDTFINMASEKHSNYENEKFPKNWLKEALAGMHHTIRLYSDMGYNTIVDHVLLNVLESLRECVDLLHEHPVLFVHVTCPIEELRRREEKRGDRQIGQAESQLSILEPQDTDIYDLIVDTHNDTQDKCIHKIINALNNFENFTAFKTLRAQRVE